MTAPCPVSVVWVDDSPPTPCVLPHGHDGPHQYEVAPSESGGAK